MSGNPYSLFFIFGVKGLLSLVLSYEGEAVFRSRVPVFFAVPP